MGALADFSKLMIRELPKSKTVFHTTDSAPAISTNPLRLIPESLSATHRPDYNWGNEAYSLQLPAGAKVGELKSIFDLLDKNSEAMSPMELGQLLRKYAHDQSLDALKIGNVFGVGTEWAVLNPEYVAKAKKR